MAEIKLNAEQPIEVQGEELILSGGAVSANQGLVDNPTQQFVEIEMGGTVYEFPSGMDQASIKKVLDGVHMNTKQEEEGMKISERNTVADLDSDDPETLIRDAASTVGINPQHALAIAYAESKLDPTAQNPRSSAGGLFQFIDGTWEESVNKHGATYGVALEDKYDARANALLGAEFLKSNSRVLEKVLGREPTLEELYMSHFLGVGGAKSTLVKLDKMPNAPATDVFSPAVIRANPSIFREGVTAREAMAVLTRRATRAATRFEVQDEDSA